MGYKCCVKGCRTGYEVNLVPVVKKEPGEEDAGNDNGPLSLFRFPFSRVMLTKWAVALKRPENFRPYPSMKICSRHFASKDFIRESQDVNCTRIRNRKDVPLLRRRLRPAAVPTLNLDSHLAEEDEDEEDDKTAIPLERPQTKSKSSVIIIRASHKKTEADELSERPYACAYCGKSFSQNGTLKRHHQTCKNARNWHLTAGSGRSASSSRQKREDGSGLDLSMNTSGMDVDEEDEPLDKELEEEELREAEEADAAMEAAEMAQRQNFLTPEISAQGTAVLTGEDFVDGVLPQAQESDDGSDSAANSANAGKPGAGKSSIDAICATLAEKRCYNPIQSASVLEESLSPGTQVFMSQMESRTVGQSTLTGLIDYLLLKGKLYRCEHCQIFFLDSALYFLHRSQHAANSPYTCSVCGHVAQEKYGFHSHFIEQHSKSTPVKKA